MSDPELWDLPDVDVSWAAARVGDEEFVGHRARALVAPASVVKVQVALTVASAFETGVLDATSRVRLGADVRTPGPVGMSLMDDPVEMSLRDLLVSMMTISDNVATDALLRAVGLRAVNDTTAQLGLGDTFVASGLRALLDGMAHEAGFGDYALMAAHDHRIAGPPTDDEVRARLAGCSALDPERGSRTTPADMVLLLSLVWTDRAGPPPGCARVRSLMGRQLTRSRIASGFGTKTAVAAKSGGLMGVVRNEVGVVSDPGEPAVAVAVFTRREPGSPAEPAEIDAAIGRLARRAVDRVRSRG